MDSEYSLLFVKPSIVCGVTKHSLNISSSLGKRYALNPVFDIQRAAFGDPSLCSPGTGIVSRRCIFDPVELPQHLRKKIHAQLDIERRIVEIGSGDRSDALTFRDQLARCGHYLH